MNILIVAIFIVLGIALWYVNIARTRAAFWVGWTNGRLDDLRLYLEEHGLDGPSPAWLERAVEEDSQRMDGISQWWRLPPRMIPSRPLDHRKP